MRTTPLDFVAKAVFKIKYMHLISTAIQRGNARCIINIPIGRSWDKKRKHKTTVSVSRSGQNTQSGVVLGVSGCWAAGRASSPAKTASASPSEGQRGKAMAGDGCDRGGVPTRGGQTRRGGPAATGKRLKGSDASAILPQVCNRSVSELREAGWSGSGLARGKASSGGAACQGN